MRPWAPSCGTARKLRIHAGLRLRGRQSGLVRQWLTAGGEAHCFASSRRSHPARCAHLSPWRPCWRGLAAGADERLGPMYSRQWRGRTSNEPTGSNAGESRSIGIATMLFLGLPRLFHHHLLGLPHRLRLTYDGKSSATVWGSRACDSHTFVTMMR